MPCSAGATKEFYKLQYQNATSQRRFGQFRSAEAILAAHEAMPAAERQARLAWGQSVVRKVRTEARRYLKSIVLSNFAQFAERALCLVLPPAAPQEYTRRTWLEQSFLSPFFDNWPMSNIGFCTLITKVGTSLYCLSPADAVNLLTQIKVPKWC